MSESIRRALPKKKGMQVERLLGELSQLVYDEPGFAELPERIKQAVRDAEFESRLGWIDMVDAVRNPALENPPTIGQIAGGEALFYRGETNMLFGTDSVGKSLIMIRIALQELEAGNKVVWLDYEETNARRLARRFIDLGVDPEVLVNLRAVFPGRRLTERDIDTLVDISEGATLFVLDSVGEYLGAHGANENYDDHVTQWLFQHLCRPITSRVVDPPAMVFIDHQSKSSDGTSSAGSKRKRAGITGAAYNVAVEDGEGWSRKHSGFACVRCVKDRDGYYDRGELVTFIEVEPRTDSCPLIVRITTDEPLMHGLTGGVKPEATRDVKEAAIRDLVHELGFMPSKTRVVQELNAIGMSVSGSFVREILAKIPGERTEAMMAVNSDPDGA